MLGEGDCSHTEGKIWIFLQNFHLRIFTFNIFLKQFKEQKKKLLSVSSCKVCTHI